MHDDETIMNIISTFSPSVGTAFEGAHTAGCGGGDQGDQQLEQPPTVGSPSHEPLDFSMDTMELEDLFFGDHGAVGASSSPGGSSSNPTNNNNGLDLDPIRHPGNASASHSNAGAQGIVATDSNDENKDDTVANDVDDFFDNFLLLAASSSSSCSGGGGGGGSVGGLGDSTIEGVGGDRLDGSYDEDPAWLQHPDAFLPKADSFKEDASAQSLALVNDDTAGVEHGDGTVVAAAAAVETVFSVRASESGPESRGDNDRNSGNGNDTDSDKQLSRKEQLRRQKVVRYLDKKKRRQWSRASPYTSRQRVANNRARHQGRFLPLESDFVPIAELQRRQRALFKQHQEQQHQDSVVPVGSGDGTSVAI